MTRPRPVRALLAACAVVLGLLTVATPVVAAPAARAANPPCGSFTLPVRQLLNPSIDGTVLVSTATQLAAERRAGYTRDLGVVFFASATAVAGTTPIHRLQLTTTRDQLFVPQSQVAGMTSRGYRDRGIAFHAVVGGGAGCRSVMSFQLGARHRVSVDATDATYLRSRGAVYEGVRFWAGRAPVSSPATVFSIAVMPDTQQEVKKTGDTRFADRSRWLVDRRGGLSLGFVLHVGDVTNAGWLLPEQLTVASEAMRPLESAGIPYVLAVGNHDTAAVGVSGSAYDPARTRQLVRDTDAFNGTFDAARFTHVAGAYQAGKVDNIYTRYTAGGKSWMVLSLELWPRTEVVAWARDVVAAHPDDNVIVQTHAYLIPSGEISRSNGGYGANSPQYLYDNLIKLYPNITMVFGGHNGAAAHRTDIGVHGNVIHSFLQCFHSNTTNPVRVVRVDTATRTVSSYVKVPSNNTVLGQFSIPAAPLTITG